MWYKNENLSQTIKTHRVPAQKIFVEGMKEANYKMGTMNCISKKPCKNKMSNITRIRSLRKEILSKCLLLLSVKLCLPLKS